MNDLESIDHRTLKQHLQQGMYRSGEMRKKWRLISLQWPIAIFAITAAPRPGAPAEYCFRFDLTDYPSTAPTAGLWDCAQSVPYSHAHWPAGGNRFAKAICKDWENGRAVYLPCDRVPLATHQNWRTEHPALTWKSTCDITFYLEILHELFQSDDYHGLAA